MKITFERALEIINSDKFSINNIDGGKPVTAINGADFESCEWSVNKAGDIIYAERNGELIGAGVISVNE